MTILTPQGDKNQSLKSQRQLRYLSQSILLEESGNLKLIVSASTIISVIVLAFLLWAALMKVQEITIAIGEVLPSGQIRTVQHLEGGIVDKVFATEDQLVKKNQVVMTLSPVVVASELDKLYHQEISAQIDLARLRSVLDEKPDNFNQAVNQIVNKSMPYIKNKEHFYKMIKDSQSLLASELFSKKQSRDILKRQIAQKRSEIALYEEKKNMLKTHVELLQKEKDIYDKLKGSEAISEVTELTSQRQLNQAKGELAQALIDEGKAKDALHEAESRLQESDSEDREKILKEIHVMDSNATEARSAITKLVDRSHRLGVISPVDGVIKGLTLKPGSVIQPGGNLFDVVPVGTDLVVEARVSTRDIGHIHVGDLVHAKITTYEFTRYGQIDGRLESVSASTFVDEKGERYYKAIIKLSRNYVGKKPGMNMVTPGMAVVADIVTGKKSLLSYVLKPIYRTVSNSFRER